MLIKKATVSAVSLGLAIFSATLPADEDVTRSRRGS